MSIIPGKIIMKTMAVHLAIKNISNFYMLSKLFNEEEQSKIKNMLNDITFPVKCYCITIILLLLLITYYLFRIQEKMI